MGAPHGNKNASGPHKKGWYHNKRGYRFTTLVSHAKGAKRSVSSGAKAFLKANIKKQMAHEQSKLRALYKMMGR